MEILLAIVAGVLLVFYWHGPNAVWGGATLGIIVGFIVSLGTGDGNLFPLIFAIGTFVGVIFEWVGWYSRRLK